MGDRVVRPPRQERSRETYERILDTAEQLLADRPFELVSIDDIVNEAVVSRSSFYARFASKEALLDPLFERYAQRAREAVTLSLGAHGLDPAVVIEESIRSYLTFARRFQLPTSTFESAGLVRRDRLENDVLSMIAEAYLHAVGRPDDRELAVRVAFAARSSAAIIIRAVSPPHEFAVRLGFDDERLIREVTVMATAYLSLDV